MSGDRFDERDEAPTIEVRVFRRGQLVHQELCESEAEAAVVVDAWAELDGVECEVDDLSVRHRLGDVAEPEPAELRDEEYADALEATEAEGRARRYE